jgi:hypothetical protein
MAYYLNDVDLFYEIILSKGKGELTEKGKYYIQLVGENAIRKKIKDYSKKDDMLDCLQTGLLLMLENWYNFNEKKYKVALPYFTEVFKRATAQAFNEIYGKKRHQPDVKWLSLDSTNSGKGMHNM